MMCVELGADRSLIRTVSVPAQITLVKRPSLERQRLLLGFEPLIDLEEGVRMVCNVQRKLAAAATRLGTTATEVTSSPVAKLRQVSASG